MLIINNGVPKSGSSWVQKVLIDLCRIGAPGKEWLRKDWHHASIKEDKLGEYLEAHGQEKEPVAIKAHYRPSPELRKLLVAHGAKMIVSYRNMPDSIVSLYHHHVRVKQTDLSMDRWLARMGDVQVRSLLKVRIGWANRALMVPFEQARQQPDKWVRAICDHCGVPIPEDRLAAFCTSSLVSPEKIADGKHIRTGGAGAAHELPDHWRKVIEEIEAAALSG